MINTLIYPSFDISIFCINKHCVRRDCRLKLVRYKRNFDISEFDIAGLYCINICMYNCIDWLIQLMRFIEKIRVHAKYVLALLLIHILSNTNILYTVIDLTQFKIQLALQAALVWLCGVVLWWFLRETEVKLSWARLVHGWVTIRDRGSSHSGES